MIQDCNNVLEQLNLSEKTERLFSSNYSQVPLLTLSYWSQHRYKVLRCLLLASARMSKITT